MLNTPEAAPASWGGMRLLPTTEDTSVGNAKPCPQPYQTSSGHKPTRLIGAPCAVLASVTTPSRPLAMSAVPRLMARGPIRRATREDASDPATKPKPKARNTSPAASGPKPKPCWRKMVRPMKNADRPAKKVIAITRPKENAGSRNSRRLTRGVRPVPSRSRSYSTNAASAGPAAASDSTVQGGHPSDCPSTSG